MRLFKHIINWYFSRNALPLWCILVLDIFTVYFSLFIVYILNTGLAVTVGRLFPVLECTGIYTLCFLVGFRLFHTYSGVIRFSSFIDLFRIGGAVAVGLCLSLIVRQIFSLNNFLPFRARELVLGSILSLLLLWAGRVFIKFLYDSMFRRDTAERAFIFGIRNGGISIAKSIRNQDPARFVVTGFVTDTPQMYGRYLQGVKVYGVDRALVHNMVKQNVKALFVTPYRSETLRENENLVNELIQAGIKIYMIPSEQQWDGHSNISHNQLREVDIEDLLPREKIEVDMDEIGRKFNNHRIMITGAAGSIGSEIVRQISKCGPAELLLIDQAETPLHDIRLMMAREFPEIKAYTVLADIADQEHIEQLFAEHRPEFIFHAAAYKHVPMLEDNPFESIHNNVKGTRILADLAVKYGAEKFVMVSTDKAVNPTNVMGCSKRLCEIYVQSLDEAIKEGKVKGKTQFVTTRFGNVLGSNGSVIPLFKEQIKNGGPLTVTHPDIIRYFMLIPEACQLVLDAGTMGKGGEIFVFDMGKPVKIVELAHRMILLSGANCEIRFTGLRDGEKLYEEVLADKELVLPTIHPKIKIAKVRHYEFSEVEKVIATLIDEATRQTPMQIVAAMKRIVPEYKSRHSVYEKLDVEETADNVTCEAEACDISK